jgi:hypothetical protein
MVLMNRLGDHNYIGHYVRAMLKSAVSRPALTIQCWEHKRKPFLHLFFAKGSLNAMCLLKCCEPQRERTVRAIFACAGVTLLQDEITGDADDESRFLLHRLPSTESEATHLVAGFFRTGYDLVENTELEFTYRERKAT